MIWIPPKRKIILVDLDDTLVDRGDFCLLAMQATFRSFGVRLSLEEIASAKNENDLVIRHGIKYTDFWKRFDSFDDRTGGIDEGRIKPYHDSLGFLQMLHQTNEIVIVTDTPEPKSTIQVDRLGFRPFLKGFAAYELEEGTMGKPDLSMAIKALASIMYNPRSKKESAWNEHPDLIWVVGDSHKDVELAKNIQTYLRNYNFFANCVAIHINRNNTGNSGATFTTFGPNPLYTAAQIINSHNVGPTAIYEVCAPDMPGTYLKTGEKSSIG